MDKNITLFKNNLNNVAFLFTFFKAVSKARKVSSLVQKWQSIKQQEEPFLGSSEEEEEENNPDKQIEEWKKEHLARYRQRVSRIGIDIGSRWRLGPVI